MPTALGVVYVAIFREFLSPDVRLSKYERFFDRHHNRRPPILTFTAFYVFYEAVLTILHAYNFVEEYAQICPDRPGRPPHTSSYECKKNLEGLHNAIAGLGATGLNLSLNTFSRCIQTQYAQQPDSDARSTVCTTNTRKLVY